MVAKIRPIMSSTYITLGSRTASPKGLVLDNEAVRIKIAINGQ